MVGGFRYAFFAFGSFALFCASNLAAATNEVSFAEEEAFDRFYVGLSGQLALPEGCAPHLRRLGGAALRGGYYLTEYWAIEGEAAWLEDSAGLAADALWHWWGFEQFDPFFTIGARGWIGRNIGQVGPKAGIGAFYHLTDAFSLRCDADVTLGLDTRVEADYTLQVGVQYSF